jgi:arylsulfatase A-like enzyme
MAGAKRDPDQVVDGQSIVPLLNQSGPLLRDTLYWHYPHYHPGGATPYSAIRDGDWKLIEFFEDNHLELYNLKDDLGEKTNLAQRLPEKAQELLAKLTAWRKQVGAQFPTPNPSYDPQRADASRAQSKSGK